MRGSRPRNKQKNQSGTAFGKTKADLPFISEAELGMQHPWSIIPIRDVPHTTSIITTRTFQHVPSASSTSQHPPTPRLAPALLLLALRTVDLRKALGADGAELELVVNVLVKVAELRHDVFVRIPHAPVARLDQPPHNVLEGLGVGVPKLLCHLLVQRVRLGALVVDPLLLKLGRRPPPHQRRHPLRYLESSPRALSDHGVGPLGVEELGAVLEPEGVVELLGPRVPAVALDDGCLDLTLTPLDIVHGTYHGARVGVVLLDVCQSVFNRVEALDDLARRLHELVERVSPLDPPPPLAEAEGVAAGPCLT
mmetsp:Transcript_42630/g.106657  ORF Transcript_42630/g.106657 Transcript_42630/m.106657 type:complete len:309 (-) Transcript_42630:1252-2178(-)